MRTKVSTERADRHCMETVSGRTRNDLATSVRILAVLILMLSLSSDLFSQLPSRSSPEVDVVANPSRPIADNRSTPATVSRAERRFLQARTLMGEGAQAQGLAAARAEHVAMIRVQSSQQKISTLNAAWQPVGPGTIASLTYGKTSGRISSIAIDPSDATGNTVFLGTTGGGVWKSTNAAGPAESVTFAPLTDNLPAFDRNAGSSATASLSIGAISVQAGGTVLAGTGDPNDASDSYYGSGILRSTDGGLTWTLIQNSDDGITNLHSFVGLGFAGFAWSTVDPSLVVAAVSQSAEGVVVNASTKTSVMGLMFQMMLVLPGKWQRSPTAPRRCRRRCWRAGTCRGLRPRRWSGTPFDGGSLQLFDTTGTTNRQTVCRGRGLLINPEQG